MMILLSAVDARRMIFQNHHFPRKYLKSTLCSGFLSDLLVTRTGYDCNTRLMMMMTHHIRETHFYDEFLHASVVTEDYLKVESHSLTSTALKCVELGVNLSQIKVRLIILTFLT